MRFTSCGLYPYWGRFQDKRPREGQGDLKFIPALELNLVLKRNVKAKDCRTRFQSKEDRALLGDVFRPAWAVDRERCIPALPDFARHFGERAESSARAGSARGAITESLDALGDGVTIAVHACHHDDLSMPPVVS